MKRTKKILTALLAMLLCAVTLVSCSNGMQGGYGAFGSGDATTAEDSGSTGTPDSSGSSSGDLQILKSTNGRLSSEYQIIYSEAGKDYEKELATTLQAAIQKITGVYLTCKNDLEFDDDPTTKRKDKEIIVGNMVNRYEEYTAPDGHDTYNLGYVMYTIDERLVILPGSRTGMYFAIRDFLLEYFGVDLDDYNKDLEQLDVTAATADAITLDADFVSSRTINSQHLPYIDIALSKYKITYDAYGDANNGTGYMMKRMAYGIYEGIVDATGAKPSMAVATANATGALIKLELVDKEENEDGDNDWIEPGKWTFEYNGDKMFTIKASSYYGFFDAAKYFTTALNNYGFYDFGEDEVYADGDYLDSATGYFEGTAYAYTKAESDTRVMFANVLFGNTAGGDGDYTYSVPAAERNKVQQIMIAEYMPDVFGCQEFNKTKRGESDAIALGGKGGLSALLSELGYEETVDPRVKNSYEESEIIPGADASLVMQNANPGDPLYGYGHGGADLVNYNGVQYTYYNNTPLFYNTATTKLIASEYYWYKYQWDKRNALNSYGEVIVHENGASDCGSKAATWGVFESIETGQRYIVVSTHMCTRSNYIRGLQAQEITSLIEKLVDIYDCPVFFGGDMNGNATAANYLYFTNSTYEEFLEGVRLLAIEKNAELEVLDPDTVTMAMVAPYLPSLLGYTLAELEAIFVPAYEAREDGEFLSLQDDLDSGILSGHISQVYSSHGYPDYDKDLKLMTPGRNDESKLSYVNHENSSRTSIDQIYVTNLNDEIQLNDFCFVVDNCSLSSSDHLPYFVDFTLEGETNEGAEWGPSVVG